MTLSLIRCFHKSKGFPSTIFSFQRGIPWPSLEHYTVSWRGKPPLRNITLWNSAEKEFRYKILLQSTTADDGEKLHIIRLKIRTEQSRSWKIPIALLLVSSKSDDQMLRSWLNRKTLQTNNLNLRCEIKCLKSLSQFTLRLWLGETFSSK